MVSIETTYAYILINVILSVGISKIRAIIKTGIKIIKGKIKIINPSVSFLIDFNKYISNIK